MRAISFFLKIVLAFFLTICQKVGVSAKSAQKEGHMTKKELTNIKNRIVRANNSFSCGGSLMLDLDIDNRWDADALAAIYVFCAEKGVFYSYLTKKIFG